MDCENRFEMLKALADALTVPHALAEGLDQITRLTGLLMETEQTVLMLRDEDREEFIVRARCGIAAQQTRIGHPLIVPARLKSILWRVRSLHQINWVDSGIEPIGFPILVAPLRIRGHRIGLLITGKPPNGNAGYDTIRRQLYRLVASFASLVIENAKVYDYLRQQFAQRSHELIETNRREAPPEDETRHLMVASLTNPSKVVRLLAQSFYKELARAGFGPDHITTAAAEILDCITRQEPVHWPDSSLPG